MNKRKLKGCWLRFLEDGFESPTGVLWEISRHFVRVCVRQGNSREEILDRLLYALDWDDEEEGRSLLDCIDDKGHLLAIPCIRFWSVYPRGFSRLRILPGDAEAHDAGVLLSALREAEKECKQVSTPLLVHADSHAIRLQTPQAHLLLGYFKTADSLEADDTPPFQKGILVGRPMLFRESGNPLLRRLEENWLSWPGSLRAELVGFA